MAVGIANTLSFVGTFQVPDFMSWFNVRFFIPRVVIIAFWLWTVYLRVWKQACCPCVESSWGASVT